MMSIMVHGSTVILFVLDEGKCVTSAVITHDRAAALSYCRSLGDACEAEAQVLLEQTLSKDPDIPAVSLETDFAIPEDLIGEFSELVFVGSKIFSNAEEAGLDNPLETLLGEAHLLYCYTNGPVAADAPNVALLIFTKADDELVAMIIRSSVDVATVLEELRHFSAARRDQVAEALQLLPRSDSSIYDLDPCTAEVLAVGYLTRAERQEAFSNPAVPLD